MAVAEPLATKAEGRVSPDGRVRAVATSQGPRRQRVKLEWTDGRQLSFAETIHAWRQAPNFGAWFSSILADAPFDAFFWECPPTTKAVANATPFEFAIVRARGFARASPADFSEHLDCADVVATFPNLGGDAVLCAPCELAGVPRETYGHLAAFSRDAPADQLNALWRHVGAALATALEDRGPRPTWLSTEGSGVPWLHVRLDSSPKYYKTDAFRPPPNFPPPP
ncbi:hypothetical protein CTAYLR_007451 [Chrysophaeum taylorii]|uniref:Uncharacterized protein n=1 Tax=Chrysophaeum taylorii TaxID=2483200 RepID=A0AAD7UDG9_9STRA|nr:hypothetical protein CTAYLR_007451 [Chrysophaeum taylorii]